MKKSCQWYPPGREPFCRKAASKVITLDGRPGLMAAEQFVVCEVHARKLAKLYNASIDDYRLGKKGGCK